MPGDLGRPLRLSVVIPVRNESDSIGPVVRELAVALDAAAIAHEILVVDDHSTDGTRDVVAGLRADCPTVRCIANADEPGFGMAVRAGLDHYVGDAVAIVMGDGSDAPEDLVRYYRTLGDGWDCVFGSRFMPGSTIVDYPLIKRAINRLANFFVRVLFRMPLNDTTNAFKIYRRDAIDGSRPLLSKHFNLTVELPLKAITRGFSYAIIPISWRNRKDGVSKLKLQEMGSRYLFIVLYVWLERLLSKGDYRRSTASEQPGRPTPSGSATIWAFVAVAAAAVAPFYALARYNRPIVDDFLFAKQIEAVGYFFAQWDYYLHIYGRYTALALISLNPMTFGPKYLWFESVTPLLYISGLVASSTYLARKALGGSATHAAAWALGGVALAAYLAAMPSPWQGLYWWASQNCFELGSILTALIAGGLLRLWDDAEALPRRPLAIVCGLVIAAMGTNELTDLNLVFLFAVFTAWRRIANGTLGKRYWVLAAAFIGGACLGLLAPGNLYKFGYSSGMPIIPAARYALQTSVQWMIGWVSAPTFVTASLAAMVVFSSAGSVGASRSRTTWRAPAILLVLAWLALLGDSFFLHKSVGLGPHPARSMNTVYFFFVLQWFAFLAMLVRAMPNIAARLTHRPVAAGIALALAFFTFARPTNTQRAYDDLLSGRARTYARESDERFAQFHESRLSVVEVDPYTATPLTIMNPATELTDDVANNLNICVQNYFNKHGVRITRDRTLTRLQSIAAEAAPSRPLLVYVPIREEEAMFRQLQIADGDRFYVGGAEALVAHANQERADPIYLSWDERYDSDRLAGRWRDQGAVKSQAAGATVIEISKATFNRVVSEARGLNQQDMLDSIDAEVAKWAGSPARLAAALQQFTWTEGTPYAAVYKRSAAALDAAIAASGDAVRSIAPGIETAGGQLVTRPDGGYDAFILIRTTKALPGDYLVLLHAIPGDGDISGLPETRRQFRFDDWGFSPDPPTSKWPPNTWMLLKTSVKTNLRRISLRIGLYDPKHGTIGVVDYPPVDVMK